MARPINVQYGGKEVTGEDMSFTVKDEPWVDYTLEDGSLVRVRLVVTNIVRSNEMEMDGGDPLVLIKSKTVVAYHAGSKSEEEVK